MKTREETVPAHCPTAFAAIVISSVRIHGTDRPPCCIGSEAISEGTHGRDLLPLQTPLQSVESSTATELPWREKDSSGVKSR